MATSKAPSRKNGKKQIAPKRPAPQPRPRENARRETGGPAGPTVVGIAGSAGSLTALQTFFGGLPAKSGLAFVVVTHLHPEHESHMAEILRKHTQMTVSQVTRKTKLEADHVYVVPPNRNILITDMSVDLAEFHEPRGQRSTIDFFLRTLASAHPDAVAIILSGSGSDGALGVKAVKEAGGIVMIQDPQDAEYDSMPAASIATGVPDIILPVDQLPGKLMEIIGHVPTLPRNPDGLTQDDMELVSDILAEMRKRTGHDFNHYKRSTVIRRIRRRMQITAQTDLHEYLEYMRAKPDEGYYLLNDLLIGVTNFFRDPAAWEAVGRTIIPKLFEKKPPGAQIRVWSIGCATGEEAYSLAILLAEYAADREEQFKIQVFASDLDEDALARAREGIYPTAIEADVSPARLQRFFTRSDHNYQVRRELRDMVLFTNHSILRDPPFSRQDLICCRNLLIYMEREIQQQVLDVFHYALASGGYLFLGNSETADAADGAFQAIDKPHRLFRALPWSTQEPHVPSLPLTVPPLESIPHVSPIRHQSLARQRSSKDVQFLDEQHRASLETSGPSSILVNGEYTILNLSDTAGRYLRQPRGPLTSDLLKLVRPELRAELSSGLFQAFDRAKATVSTPVTFSMDGQPRQITIAVRPLPQKEAAGLREQQALVIFLEDETVPVPLSADAQQATEGRDSNRNQARILHLEAEVLKLREALQTTTEQYDSSIEEMKAANEELQSINEEYRMTTEELETSKEELQAVNEELQTVNSELSTKLEEISRVHAELESVLKATEIATLFLDHSMKIQRFTPALTQFFNILPSDVGRPIAHLNLRLEYANLMKDTQEVLTSLAVIDREVRGAAGEWFLIRLRPYRTLNDRIEGAVITFVNITELKQADSALRQLNQTLEARVEERTRELAQTNVTLEHARDMFRTLFHVNPIPTSLTRLEDGLFFDVNEAYSRFFEMPSEEILGHTSAELKLPFQQPERAEIVSRVAQAGLIRAMEMEIRLHSGETRSVLASLQYTEVDGKPALLSTFIDITERVRAERQIRALASNLTSAEQKERHRISQVLHDDLQQRLFAVKMQLSFLQEAYFKKDDEAVRRDSSNVEGWLNDAIETTRRLSIDLSPVILRGENLAEAVAWLADEMRTRYSLELKLDVREPLPRVDDDLRVLLFHTVRELLFNVVKHGGVLQAGVVLDRADGRLRVTVHDGGQGFDAEAVMADPKAAHGLLELRNRLTILGCTMQVESRPGDGTRVVIEAPGLRGAMAPT